MRLRFVGLSLLMLMTAPARAAEEEVRIIPSRPGVTEAVLVIRPDKPPSASVILFTGGAGAIGLKPDWPKGKRGGNFLVRSADLFARAGFLVAVLDVPSDSSALWNLRGTQGHARDVAAVIAMTAESPESFFKRIFKEAILLAFSCSGSSGDIF